MKFTKKSNDAPKKPKALLLTETGKIKKKNGPATNGKVLKGAKQAAGVIKKAIVQAQNESPSQGTVKNKTTKKQDQLNSAQLGLLVDAYLKKKTQGKSEHPTSDSPDKSTKQNNLSTGSGVPKRKRNRSKNKQMNVTADKTPESAQLKPAVAKPVVTSVTSKKKRGNKRQATEPIADMEVYDLSSVKEVASKKNQKRKKGKVEMKEKLVASTSDNPDYKLNPKDVLKAVDSALELHKKNLSSSKKLLDADPEPIFLNLIFHYTHPLNRVMKFDLNHSLVSDSSDICLFVSDIASSTDESTSKWKELLKKNKVTRISEVMTLTALRKEHTQFIDKRKLSSRFDVFLVEKSIYNRVFTLVGDKYFHSKRKTPMPVKLIGDNVKANIESALTKTTAKYKAAADTFSIQIGHTAMKNKKIQENILKVWEDYPKHFGVFWENIKTASLAIPEIPNLPLFCSLAAPEGSPRNFGNLIWTKGKGTPVVGEISTKIDSKAIVFPSGKVIVKSPPKKKKEKSLEEKLAKKEKKKANRMNKAKNVKSEEDENSDDDIGGRADMLEFESDSDEDEEEMETNEEEMNTEDESNTVQNNRQVMKGTKKKQNQEEEEEEEDSEESDVDRAEEDYMTELAATKELQAEPEKGKTVDVNPSDDSDDDSDAEDDDLDGSDDSMDEMVFGNDSSNEEPMEDYDSEEEPNPSASNKNKGKPGPKPKSEVQTGQPGKKFNKGNQNQSGGKKQNQKFQNKPGAKKSSPVQKSKQLNKKNAQTAKQVTGAEKSKKQNATSFQGVKAGNNKKKNRNKSQIKNKVIAKKMQ